jgi:fructose-1,6-bisphosphatase
MNDQSASVSPSTWSNSSANEATFQPQLRLLIEVVARACKHIAISVNKGALGEVLGRPTPRTCRAKSRRSST